MTSQLQRDKFEPINGIYCCYSLKCLLELIAMPYTEKVIYGWKRPIYHRQVWCAIRMRVNWNHLGHNCTQSFDNALTSFNPQSAIPDEFSFSTSRKIANTYSFSLLFTNSGLSIIGCSLRARYRCDISHILEGDALPHRFTVPYSADRSSWFWVRGTGGTGRFCLCGCGGVVKRRGISCK